MTNCTQNTSSSRAAVFTAANRPLEIRQFPLPRLRDGEILVRVTCCTVCGSDLHTFLGRRETPTPTILGHEILGEVAALGPGTPPTTHDGRPLAHGDRITWSIAASCGVCFACTHDLPQKCDRLFKYGHERISATHPLSGGLAEYCHLARGTAILVVPDDLPDPVACPASCATATVAAVLRAAGGCRDETVLVQGAGMLGLTACAMARWSGAREVIVCDIDEHRLARSCAFGATRSALITGGDDDDGELDRIVEESTAGRGVDVALELSGSGEALARGLGLLRVGGRHVWAGAVFPAPPLELDAETVVRRLLSIRGVHNYAPRDLATAVEFLAHHQGKHPFDELVAATFPLSQVDNALRYSIEKRCLRVAVVP